MQSHPNQAQAPAKLPVPCNNEADHFVAQLTQATGGNEVVTNSVNRRFVHTIGDAVSGKGVGMAVEAVQKSVRPTLHEETGRFTMLLHHSRPESYPEEAHSTVQVCIPYQGARYDVLRSGECGTRLTHRLRTGDILVVPAGQPHAVNWLRSADILSLHMTNAFLETVLGTSVPDFHDALVLHDPLISQMAIELRCALKEDNTSSLLLGSCAAVVAYRVAKEAAGITSLLPDLVTPLAPHERSRIAEYIDTHLHRAIRVAELAAILGLSQWHFLRRFHVTEGTTPNQYIIKRRVDRASTMLTRTNMSVTQIAIEVGMSPNHFSRSFLKASGVPPAAFRRRRRGPTAIAR